MKKFAATFLLLIFSLTVFADQAAYITKEQARRAVALLKDKKQIKHFCAPCDDKSIRLEEIKSIEATPTGYEGTWEVKINGEGIDLAYVYFSDKHGGKWKNAAKKLKIKVQGVPKTLPDEKHASGGR